VARVTKLRRNNNGKTVQGFSTKEVSLVSMNSVRLLDKLARPWHPDETNFPLGGFSS
jgi:hypothetical protein